MRIQLATAIVATLFALACSAHAADALTLHVAPGGNDAWSGMLNTTNATRTDDPVASLNSAVSGVQELRAKRNDHSAALVLVKACEYPITAPLALTPDDSGLHFEAATSSRLVFNGDRISKFRNN